MKRSFLLSLIAVLSFALIGHVSAQISYPLVSDGGGGSGDTIGSVVLLGAGPIIVAVGLDSGAEVNYADGSSLRNLFIKEVHIHVSALEPDGTTANDWANKATKKGKPRPGQFEYASPNPIIIAGDAQGAGMTVPDADTPNPPDGIYIAVHVELGGTEYDALGDPSGEVGAGEESAWGWDEDFPGANWAQYIEYVEPISPAPGAASTTATTWGALKAK